MSKEAKETLAILKDVPTKEKLEEMLTIDTVICKFKKLDGDERTMSLTHNLLLIPKENHPKGENKPHEKNITGWCADVSGWRSFRYDRLISADLDVASYIANQLAEEIRKEVDKSIIASMTEKLTEDEEKMLADDKIYAAEAGREPYTLAELKDLRLKFGGPCI